jgi:hypothetical protein
VFLRAMFLLTDKRYDEAEAGFLEAEETPALLPSIPREAQYAAAFAALGRHYGPKGKPEDLQRAAKHLRRYAFSGNVTPAAAAQSFPIAFLAGDRELARHLVNEGLRQRPQDPKLLLSLLFWKAKLELTARAYVPAIEAANEMLKLQPDDPRALQVQKDALKKLRQYIQQADSEKRTLQGQPSAAEKSKRP